MTDNLNSSYLMNQVGKFFLVGFDGIDVTEEITLLITKYNIGFIILSGKNFTNASQAKKLIQDLQTIAMESNYEHPLIFVIDEEGGMLNSLFDKEYITQFPGAMTLSATNSEEIVYQVYRAIAKELKAIGFSMYLGPVLDILKNTANSFIHQMIGVRSYGYNLETVLKFSLAAARAFKDENMINCGKHFPGYGSATINSNFELPMISESTDQLIKFNMVPYIELTKDNLLDSVLVGGCAVPTVNPNDLHACLSPTIVTDLLRGKVAFDGVVISECLLLEALDKNFGVVQGCISAFSVGCDLIMLCSNFEIQQQAINALKSVIKDQLIDQNKIIKSLERIKKLQNKLPLWNEVLNETNFLSNDVLFQHRLLSNRAYEKSITVIRDSGLPITNNLTPFVENDNTVLLLTPLIAPLYETVDVQGNKSHINNLNSESKLKGKLNYGEDVFMELGKMLAEYKPGYNFYHTSYNSNGLTSFHEELILKSKVLLFFTAETTNNLYQVGVSKHVSMLCNSNSLKSKKNGITNRQMIIISVSSPTDFLYDINIGGSPTGYICTYDYTINALCNLPKILFGDFKAVGRIPGLNNVDNKVENKSNDRNKSISTSWLVESFNFNRDFENMIQLLKNNGYLDQNLQDYSLNSLKRLYSDGNNHHSFVIRNTSSKIILGISTVWVYSPKSQKNNIGNIVLLLVDKNKRNIAIGTYLYSKTMKYLFNDCKCSKIYLGNNFPKLSIKNDLVFNNTDSNQQVLNFFKSFGWDFSLDSYQHKLNVLSSNRRKRSFGNIMNSSMDRISINKLISTVDKQHITNVSDKTKSSWDEVDINNMLNMTSKKKLCNLMRLDDISNWKVAENLVRQLQVVGIMFDICKNPIEILSIQSNKNFEDMKNNNSGCIYAELCNDLLTDYENQYLDQSGNLDIIVALEPTKKSIVGSVVVFNNKSKFSKFYSFLDQMKGSNDDVNSKDYACITGTFIDPLYNTLSEVFKLGLICTALMYVKGQYNNCSQCFLTDIEDKQIKSLQDNGFEVVNQYHNYYSVITVD